MKSAAGLAAHCDGDHRIAVVRILGDLVGDHGEQQAMFARRR